MIHRRTIPGVKTQKAIRQHAGGTSQYVCDDAAAITLASVELGTHVYVIKRVLMLLLASCAMLLETRRLSPKLTIQF